MIDRTEYWKQYARDSHYRMFMKAVDLMDKIEAGELPEQQYKPKEPVEKITFEL